MKKTVALLRVSTDMQELTSQKTGITEYILKNNIVIDEWIKEEDVSGYSTSIDKRKGLMKIKQMAIDGELKQLIIFNLDRIGRSTELLQYISLLNQLDVKILSVTEGEIDGMNINNQLLTYIKLWQNENESIKTSVRTQSGLLAVNKQNKYAGGQINYGYRLNKETGQFEINPEESEIVKRIFNEYLIHGCFTIVRELNKEGIKKRNAVGWETSNILAILKNKIYIGYKQYGGYKKVSKDKTIKSRKFNKDEVQYQEYNPNLQIIDNETFFKAQKLISERNNIKDKSNRNTTRTKELLEGLVYHECADGSIKKMHIDATYKSHKGNEYRYTIYRCKYCKINGFKNIKKSCTSKKINNMFEKQLFEYMPNYDVKQLEENIKKSKEKNEKNNIEILKELNKSLDKEKKLFDNGMKELKLILLGESCFDREVINDMIKNSKQEIKEIENQISYIEKESKVNVLEYDNSKNILEKYKNFNNIYSVATIEEKKALVNELVDKVILRKDKLDIIFNLIY